MVHHEKAGAARAQPSGAATDGSSVPEPVEEQEDEHIEEEEADYGFKMPENFDIPQDYIQLIVPKKSLGKMPCPIFSHFFAKWENRVEKQVGWDLWGFIVIYLVIYYF